MQYRIIENGLLRVSSNGNIYKKNATQWEELKQYSVSKTSKGQYKMVWYKHEGEKVSEYVHRLVATAFIPNPNNKPQINHIDGNPTNNVVENLEWCTARENSKHALSTGLRKKYICEVCGKEFFGNIGICTKCSNKIIERIPAQLKKYKNVGRYIDALESVAIEQLSDEQAKIALHLISGKSYAEIGRIRGTSRQNVEYHKRKMFNIRKRGVK